MTDLTRLLAGNAAFAAGAPARRTASDARPSRQLAVLTCMDARIDVLGALGLQLGEAHVLRNAGGRVTDDVLRSLALSAHALGVDSVVVMEHTECGLSGVTDDQLRRSIGADIDFHSIDDHRSALRADVETLVSTPWLAPLRLVAGLLYDTASGRVEEVVREERP